MNDKLIKKLSKSCLFAICPDAKRCKRVCENKYLTKVFSRKAKILCMHELVNKEPVFYRIDNKEQTMKTRNIYPASNSLPLKKIMAKYSLSEILCVPIEVAKYNHKACCINFFGDILRPASEFPNNSHGVDFFILKVTGVARTSGIKKILMGLESTGHYHRNLTPRLKLLGFDVAVINPFDSWKEGFNKNAKIDKIDLGSIAKALISGKFSSSYVPGGIYYSLRRATRTRPKFILRRTDSQNVIAGLVDQLFPGLWDKDDSIFFDRWGRASLLVIQRYPTPQRVLRSGEARLARFLRKNNTKLTGKTARKIISAARCSLTSNNPGEQTMDILALRSHIMEEV